MENCDENFGQNSWKKKILNPFQFIPSSGESMNFLLYVYVSYAWNYSLDI